MEEKNMMLLSIITVLFYYELHATVCGLLSVADSGGHAAWCWLSINSGVVIWIIYQWHMKLIISDTC